MNIVSRGRPFYVPRWHLDKLLQKGKQRCFPPDLFRCKNLNKAPRWGQKKDTPRAAWVSLIDSVPSIGQKGVTSDSSKTVAALAAALNLDEKPR